MSKETQNRDYNTLSEAIDGLRKQGYKEDLNLKPHCLECSSSKLEYHPEDFQVDSYYRFEGMSDPDDNSIVYAISSNDGIKGVLVDAYGAYSENLSPAMVLKLKIIKNGS